MRRRFNKELLIGDIGKDPKLQYTPRYISSQFFESACEYETKVISEVNPENPAKLDNELSKGEKPSITYK